ncbi:hypothetical protein KC19_11G043900 [Ceratodon purpureus]|uniref:TIR domain-containing protein n=1 Tax=Ceratodon purpureus TaxID=3225 RepID=A0A8T0GB81_CERPU|nr:hypothetical protein KC19_11G043900 [Ceratodon purpureus]
MESAGPKRRRIGESQSKHDIFLSHSGQEKNFVEQLYHDLKRMKQRPFFDQDSNCLAKAEKFAPEIIEAAGRCRVGVVVVSEGYLTSKWPMLELSRFVECGVKVFPLFFKLSPSDLKENEVETRWKQSWRKLVERGEVNEEVLELWSKAAKELRSSNGLEYAKFADSEYKYRCAVVEEICRLWPARPKFSTDVPREEVQGYERLCKVASSMFTEAKVMGWDEKIHKYLGLYGMGSVGKTTLCKAMCSYSEGEFGGRVCYLELPSDQASERIARNERLARLKHAVRQLAAGFDRSVSDSISEEAEEQGWECLEDGLRIQLPVFLAIDNVGDFETSRREARKYLNVGLPSGSKVLVTGRSQEILRSVLGKTECCKPIPRLEWLEAAMLFLSYAAPSVISSVSFLKTEEREIVERCLSECRFEDNGYPSSQYHPLVLRALGTYFHDVDSGNVMSWEEALENKNKLQRSREARNVNAILGLNYHSLSEQVKLVFLDCALYSLGSDEWKYRPWWSVGEPNYLNMWVSWISEVHGISPSDAKLMMKELQRLSLVEDSSSEVLIHDVYKEFARVLVEKEGSKEWQWWMSQASNATQLERLVLNEDQPIIGRAIGRILDCRSLVYLELVDCDDIGPNLEVGSLQSLRVLCVYSCDNLKRVVCSCSNGHNDQMYCSNRAPSRGCMSELVTVKLRYLASLEDLAFLRHCWSLQHLEISDVNSILYLFPAFDADCGSYEPINFRYLKALRTFSMRGVRDMPGFDCDALVRWLLTALQLKNLTAFEYRGLAYEDFQNEEAGVYTIDLNDVVQLSPRLSVLSLALPKQIEEVKGLHLLSALTTLNLHWCRGLRQLLDLRCLPKLKWLCVHGCCKLEALPLLGPEVRDIPCTGLYSLRGHQPVFLDWEGHECLLPYCYNQYSDNLGWNCSECEKREEDATRDEIRHMQEEFEMEPEMDVESQVEGE